MSTKVVSLDEFKNRNRPLEFSWSWEPLRFYPITHNDIPRIMELILFSTDRISANFRRRK